jgi:hypothetical protein
MDLLFFGLVLNTIAIALCLNLVVCCCPLASHGRVFILNVFSKLVRSEWQRR